MSRLLLILLLLALIYWAGRSLWKDLKTFKTRKKRSQGPSGAGENPRLPVSDVLVQDPVCGVYCPKKKALTAIYRGKVYNFCSEECRQKFLQEKASFN